MCERCVKVFVTVPGLRRRLLRLRGNDRSELSPRVGCQYLVRTPGTLILAHTAQIESSCRSTRIPSSFDLGDRQQSINLNRRRTTKYASEHNTRDLHQTRKPTLPGRCLSDLPDRVFDPPRDRSRPLRRRRLRGARVRARRNRVYARHTQGEDEELDLGVGGLARFSPGCGDSGTVALA